MGKVAWAVFYFIVLLAGVLFAYLWFTKPIVLISYGAIAALGFISYAIGCSKLPLHPTAAIPWMEGWAIFAATLAACASGAIIIAASYLTAATNAPESQKQIFDAISAAIGTLLTTLFIKRFESDDEDFVSAKIKDVFQARYTNHLKIGSPAANLVFADFAEGIKGWSWHARRDRAKRLTERLSQDTTTATTMSS